MTLDSPTLTGTHIRLEPLTYEHVNGLAAASAIDPKLYRWSPIPQGQEEAAAYVKTAEAGREAGNMVTFATVRVADGVVLGSTRFFDIGWWPWPEGHERYGLTTPDVCEIGYAWLSRDAIRTAANTEAKLLMLSHAFEVWQVLRVCLHTDARNDQSAAAIERIGGRSEGILRAHKIAADGTVRDSKRYSIVAAEWVVKARLTGLLQRQG
jgi:RimJ/RimL family protein N-acetyltransferase